MKIEYKVKFARFRFHEDHPGGWEDGWEFKVDIVHKIPGLMWSLRFWDPDLDRGLIRLLEWDNWRSDRKKIVRARERGESYIYTYRGVAQPG